MEENKTECLVVSAMQDLGRVEFDTSFGLQVEDGVTIDRVVCAQSYLTDTKIETLDKKAVYSGKITTKIVFKDSEGLYITAVGNSLFSHSFTNPQMLDNGRLVARDECTTTDVAMENGQFNVKVSIGATVVEYAKQNHCVVSQTADDIHCKKQDITLMHTEQDIDGNFNTECEIDVKGTITKILSSELNFVQTDVCALENAISITGKLNAQVIYTMDTEDGSKVCCVADSCTIKGEIEANNIDMESVLDVYSCVDASKTVINTTLNETNTVLNIETNIVVNGVAYKMVTMPTVVDAYSTKTNLRTKVEEKQLLYMKRMDCFDENIMGEVKIEGSAPDEILAVNNNNVIITKTNCVRGKLVIEGLVEGRVLYRAEDGSVQNVGYAEPFQFEQDCDDLACANAQIHAVVNSVRAKIRRSDLISVEIGLSICGTIYYYESRYLMTEIEKGDDLNFGKATYQIYFANANEDMWDVCKRLKVDADDLMRLNPTLNGNFKGGERIFVQR